MIYIVVINIILIAWLYIKYIYTHNVYESKNEELENLDSALIGYIENEDGNSIDWMLSEILELNRKEYIEIEYQREDIDKYEYIMRKKSEKDISKLKKYELTVYRLLFSEKDEITIGELEEKILKNLNTEKDVNVKSLSIKNEIEEELINQNIIDNSAKKIFNLIKKLYILETLVIMIFLRDMILGYEIILLIQNIIMVYIFFKGRPFTNKGKQLYSVVKKYKKELEYNDILKEKKIIHNIVLEKDYANSIALHIMSEAKKEFINDEIIEKNIKNTISSMMMFLYFILYFIFIFYMYI